jgi:hypothetical protein
MDNGLVTSGGTKALTVSEYDQFINSVPTKFRPIFEVNTITSLRYVELQRLHDHEEGTIQKEIRLSFLKRRRGK